MAPFFLSFRFQLGDEKLDMDDKLIGQISVERLGWRGVRIGLEFLLDLCVSGIVRGLGIIGLIGRGVSAPSEH